MKIGVIGVGFGTTVHIPAFQSEGVEVLAVAARHKTRALEASKEFNIPHYFDDYKELLAMEDLDAVSICSPHHLHYEMVMEALNQDKHILCEKPIDLSIEKVNECKRQIADFDKSREYEPEPELFSLEEIPCASCKINGVKSI